MSDEDVERLIEKLEDANWVGTALRYIGYNRNSLVRQNAAKALGEISNARAVESLCKVLKDVDSAVRQNAAVALGKIGDARSVEPLCEALGDADSNVRQNAAEALGEIGDAGAVESLCKALGDSDVCWPAAMALVKIGALSVESLCKVLTDADRDARRLAAEALGRIDDVRAVEPLCKALGDADSGVLSYLADVLEKKGDKVWEPLCKALGGADRDVRRNAAEALMSMGDREDLPMRILLCSEMDLPLRVAALNALSSQGEYYQDGQFRRYRTHDAQRYCLMMARNADPEVCKATEDMLLFLQDSGTLLRHSKRDEPKEREELLRVASSEQSSDSGEELLRGVEAPSSPSRQPGL